MTESYRAWCTDVYVNSRLNVRMELPRGRDTLLEFFERVRKGFPDMTQFRRFREELVLEAEPSAPVHRWVAVRGTHVRAGVVNAPSTEEFLALHAFLLEAAPFYLGIRPLDVESLELMYGFDMECRGNHDAVIAEALLSGSPLGRLMTGPGFVPGACQPTIGLAVEGEPDLDITVEVKSKTGQESGRDDEAPDPIGVHVNFRSQVSGLEIKAISGLMFDLAGRAEAFVESRIVSGVLAPLHEAIAFGRSGGE
ncbi:MAG: hypothetical protein IT439_06030 [Phycisphaerales bacterium]|nr:hypothetical protein [Phycisphaerales bacterium]